MHAKLTALLFFPAECYDATADPKGEKYAGFTNETISGRPCQQWKLQKPNKHSMQLTLVDEFSVYSYSKCKQIYAKHGEISCRAEDMNYCRNPDSSTGPWCYNGLGGIVRWEYCGVPKCGEFTPSCHYLMKHQIH